MILIQALMRNVGTDWFHVKGREAVNSSFASTNVNRRDGATCSSVEAFVMEVERRGCVIQSKWVANQIMGGAI